jgi:hypothetical protein
MLIILKNRHNIINKLSKLFLRENTARIVNDSFLLREVGYVRVQCKEKPVRFYELLGSSLTVLPEETQQAFDYTSRKSYNLSKLLVF